MTNTGSDSSQLLKLKTSDKKEIMCTRKVARCSMILRNMIDDLGDPSDEPIPIMNVSETVLTKVLEYCEHHQNDHLEIRQEPAEIGEWDQKFMQVDQETLFEVLLAANYMDIEELFDLCCKTVANMIKGKSAEEIRKTFNIENDFTTEEEDRIRRENEWAEDR